MTKRKILVADDDLILLMSVRLRLESEGYEVHCASDGREAVEMAREHRPDLVLLDVHMPSWDGFNAQDRIWGADPARRVPVVYITGDRSRFTVDVAQHLRARTLLRKPFDTADLLWVVRCALRPREYEDVMVVSSRRDGEWSE